MARQISVVYEDGTSETVEVRPKHLIAAERLIGKAIDQHGVEATFMAAWKASRSAMKFDAWLDTVENLVELKPESGVDPTPPLTTEPSLDESPSSPQ